MRDTLSSDFSGKPTKSISDYHQVLRAFFEERGINANGLVGRIAKEHLETLEQLGRYDEDILIGIALVKAVAHWRALATVWEFDIHLHQKQMRYETERIAKFLSRHYRTKFFLSERPKRSKKRYLEILFPYAQIQQQ